jgi:class 3 adenylate cyclase/tetratricopeptide (TPR) repeat protein
VFCDLVGFTSRAESLDPEDVEAFLRPYHERVRAELERHGGTVEKFIGDAVMALFGAPVAHEDDPERAVRAALAIRDFALEEGLELRVGITTGEALVSLDARPDAGEGMASGDVVNTAARLQSAAPVNGVVVDETTYRATRATVDYRDAEPVEAKGKSEPVAVWQATAVRSRLGVDVAHEARSPLVGRQRELAAVQDAFDRARHSRTPQLLTLVGVPGIGKSRLVYELSRIVDEDPELITWRQGRCLASGDGVTLWALSEIVKAQAGIAEQDPPQDVAEKVRRAAADVLPAKDVEWIEPHLLALAGLSEEAALGGDRRNEAFAAWRRFLEGMAEQRPLVVVFEDLHWADESLLDFVDELVDWVADVPMLVVATARPELLDRRPGWGGGKLNAITLALAPLTNDETAELLGSALGSPVVAAETQAALLERAGGNPLYAEQFAELYVERGSAEELTLPETLHGIIAARLDGLASEEKGLLLDAAVVGKVFWTAALGRDESETMASFHSLERRGFVRRQRRSSVEGQTELAFAHALVRDVAYGQIPRADRATKHVRVAEWIGSLGRPEDHAEMRAHHWRSALELAQASGRDDEALVERTRLALRDAGDRAFALNSFAAAASYYSDALALWPDDGTRAELVFARAEALSIAGDDRAVSVLEEACDLLVANGDRERAAEAEAILAQTIWFQGRQDEVDPHLRAAEALVEGAPPSRAVARVLAWSARYSMLAGDNPRGLEGAREALALAEKLDLDELRIHALTTIGSAKERLGDTTGRDDIERAVEIGEAASSPLTPGALNNLGVVIDTTDLRRVQSLYREAVHQAERFGDHRILRFLRGNLIPVHWVLGEWDEALAAADLFIAECEASPHVLEGPTRQFRGFVEIARGKRDVAFEDLTKGLELARQQTGFPEDLIPALVRYAWALSQVGRISEAKTAFSSAVPLLHRYPYARTWTVPELAWDLGRAGDIRDVFEQLPPTPGHRAMVAVLTGDFTHAADLYAEAGILLFEAESRLRAAEQLVETGRGDEAHRQLERALAFYRSAGAPLFVERGERLLAEAEAV